MSTSNDVIKALTDPRDWDDEIEAPFRWRMPDSARGFTVDVDEDGDVHLYVGTGWTMQFAHGLFADEARWLRDVWPALLMTVDAYTGGAR
ncbi:hypothetical protein HOV03_gp71 [Gordonia phage Asapag]|uniref:Uncharacterized protein n=1 Tax=Gordonia phage Asapag TaxID=2507862 RepID=A0A410TDX5_9CAUD|nr:hypothetical protein HOV03_gp71 [Gordonia phage Asapag]QAU07211.1 hypothetical protein SEA_ASAPAG_71 [Gordonia phage Asapag]